MNTDACFLMIELFIPFYPLIALLGFNIVNLFKKKPIEPRTLAGWTMGWVLLPFALALPLLGGVVFLLTLFGQQPDAVVKAFTETADWTLSTKIPPPPVIPGDSHYLCTVALLFLYTVDPHPENRIALQYTKAPRK